MVPVKRAGASQVRADSFNRLTHHYAVVNEDGNTIGLWSLKISLNEQTLYERQIKFKGFSLLGAFAG